MQRGRAHFKLVILAKGCRLAHAAVVHLLLVVLIRYVVPHRDEGTLSMRLGALCRRSTRDSFLVQLFCLFLSVLHDVRVQIPV